MLSAAKMKKCWQLPNLEMRCRQSPNLVKLLKLARCSFNCRLPKLANFINTKVVKNYILNISVMKYYFPEHSDQHAHICYYNYAPVFPAKVPRLCFSPRPQGVHENFGPVIRLHVLFFFPSLFLFLPSLFSLSSPLPLLSSLRLHTYYLHV